MSDSSNQFAHRLMSGEAQGLSAGILRGVLSLAEPVYASITSVRNCLYNYHLFRTRSLDRPVFSIGNITTGGTGKTPVVRWLAERLRGQGHRPAILLRGYKQLSGLSDEARELDCLLNVPDQPHIPIQPNPDRVAGAEAVLHDHPDTDMFILDDGFQHRRVAREFDLVLINAGNAFGYGHVLPRGMLREPLRGLKRASAFLITHAGQVSAKALDEIESTLRRYNPGAPMFHADHVHTGVRTAEGCWPVEMLRGRRCMAFCGIGDPQSFFRQLEAMGTELVDRLSFPDHCAYSVGTMGMLEALAQQRGAEMLLTTEKDWTKVSGLGDMTSSIPVGRLELAIRFRGDDEEKLAGIVGG